MKHPLVLASFIAALTASPPPAAANPDISLDRFEDRIDRWESRREESVGVGIRDVTEDRVDRLESALDRAGYEFTPWVDHRERRSWMRH